MFEIHNLSQRANINVYTLQGIRGNDGGQHVVLYDDHRTILDVLYYAHQEGAFGEDIPSVISFDHHDDAVSLTEDQKRRICSLRDSLANERDNGLMWQFVEFELSGMDDDWVRAGMEFGLIKHYIGFGHDEVDARNIENGYENYFSSDQVNHHIYSNGHPKWELGNRGVLGDHFYSWQQKQQDIMDDLHFHNGRFENNPVMPFVLDIDLDCFACECEDHIMAWPEDIFIERYVNDPHTLCFIKSLISRATFITICRETGCCGGIGEANRILEMIDTYWFDGELKSRRIM